MPKSLKPCQNKECVNLTNGTLCKLCDLKRRSKPYTKQEYRRIWNMNNKYGIDDSGFDSLWYAFKGRCGICNQELKMPENRRGQSMNVVAIDHDHNTGNIRGLLCNSCNKGLGHFLDNVDILKQAIKWLENTK